MILLHNIPEGGFFIRRNFAGISLGWPGMNEEISKESIYTVGMGKNPVEKKTWKKRRRNFKQWRDLLDVTKIISEQKAPR